MLLAVVAVLAAVLPGGGPAVPTVEVVPAADTSRFVPGNIIADPVFFDGQAMTAPEVQAFLDVKNPSCVDAADAVCLRRYRQDTPSKPADAYCQAYPGRRQESAADIVAKVGAACGISQRVLLVLMQKEQSLVTASASKGTLYASRYQKAMGYGCPDTAACDTQYYGFFNQVYNAASRFQVYRARPTSFNFRAGITRDVSYYPAISDKYGDNRNNVRCGTQSVYFQNQATAGLYNYTPYVPNAAALRAGSGVGDTCSAYGNRNFWIYFTDWFGSTQSGGAGEIATRYAQLGGSAGVLGAATSAIGCGLAGGGCYQYYARGAIHWSPATGAFMTRGWIADSWAAGGRERGTLGYPTGDEVAVAGGAYQTFQRGAIYSSAAGAYPVRGWVGDRWAALGREAGVLGFPTSEEKPAVGGVFQEFQRGVVYSSASTGAHEVHGWVLDKWTALGRERGVLGYPTSDEIATSVGAYNTFTGGAIYSTPAGGPRAVRGWIGARWLALGAGAAAVGHPLSDEQRAADGVGAYSEFSNGVIYSSAATGAHDVTGPLATAWSRLGGVSSFLGYPTADTRALGGGQVATFQGGSVYRAPGAGVAYEVHGWIGRLWQAKGGATGATLGWPTSDEQSAPDRVGVFQTFANGLVYSSPSGGAREVHGLIEDKWTALGGLTGRLGPPVTDELTLPDGKGRVSHFSGDGSIYYSPASGAWEVRGWVRSAYSALNAERGFLGYPIADEGPAGVPGAVVSRFQGGNVYASGATGAREVHGAILARYLQLGGPASALGLPTSNEYAVPGGRRSDFERGSITCNTTTGAITVTTR
ncbi:hypothetical protein [Modestobacter sp. SYSU DS0657]